VNGIIEHTANTPFGEVTYYYKPQATSPFRRKVEAHQTVQCPRCDEITKLVLKGNRGWFCPKCGMKALTES